MKLTAQEEAIFARAARTFNLDEFTEYFFQLPMSGTWYTVEDRVEQYAVLHNAWKGSGKPDTEFAADIGGVETVFKVAWDEYYGGEPMFLLPHGFRTLPWIRQFISPQITRGLAVTGTGTGKTAGVAIAALSYCAILPGFRFLNVAPTSEQANLVLGEVEKWCSNTRFSRFIQKTAGVNPLWVARPYPVITIEVYDDYPSTFTCQTVGRDATGIQGGERDWINADEAQLLGGLNDMKPILATRLRGTRNTGIPRWTKQTYITNPGRNPEMTAMMEDMEKEVEKGAKNVLVLRNVDSSVNIYLTKRQLEEQRKSLVSSRTIDRWLGGQMSAAFDDSEISEEIIDNCKSDDMTEFVEEHGVYSDAVGLVKYELPYNPDATYVVVGDVGKSGLSNLSSMNVPCVMVWEIPQSFLEDPCVLTAFYWFDGGGSYKTFVAVMRRAMMKYGAQGYYDATNVQSAMEDFDSAFAKLPTTPIFFSGPAMQKRWALTVFIMMAGDGLFKWPYIRGLWHQARIFEMGNRKRADDIIATLLVLMLAFRVESTLLDKIIDRYGWEPDDDGTEQEGIYSDEDTYYGGDRYARLIAD